MQHSIHITRKHGCMPSWQASLVPSRLLTHSSEMCVKSTPKPALLQVLLHLQMLNGLLAVHCHGPES